MVRSGRRRASDDRVHYPHPLSNHSTHSPLPSRRSLRVAPHVPEARLARLRETAATAGIVLASAGLLMGAVAPSSTTGTVSDADTVGVPPASSATPAVTARADATVTFGLESAGPTDEGIAESIDPSIAESTTPSIASAQALPAVRTPAVTDSKATDREPLSAPVQSTVVASTFGYRVDPLDGYGSEFHTGQDYASACGTPVTAAAPGTVVDSGWHAYGGGQRVVIDHGDGLKTTYNHLGALYVAAGTIVQCDAQLGAVGSTGTSTGCHLHFEVMVDDEKVDPQPWL